MRIEKNFMKNSMMKILQEYYEGCEKFYEVMKNM